MSSSDILENVSLREYTTLKTGGEARYFAKVATLEDLNKAVDFAEQNQLPYLVIGGGSNLFVSDEGFAGIVIKNELKGITYQAVDNDKTYLRAGAGEVFDEVILNSLEHGYFGLENLSAIPGTVGATPVQNVGAYGVEVKDLIYQVEAYHTPTRKQRIFSNSECQFGYRDSFFKTELGKEFIITAVHFLLSKTALTNVTYRDLANRFINEAQSHSAVREAVCAIRSQKFPDLRVLGTAGSFFKNPIISMVEGERLQSLFPELPMYTLDNDRVKIPLGFVLERLCGLKGYRRGAVGLYDKQALVLVNYGGASSQELCDFVAEITEKVLTTTGIVIEPEVRFI